MDEISVARFLQETVRDQSFIAGLDLSLVLGVRAGRVPGMTATQSEGGGLRLDVGTHGLDPGRSRRVLILEDGVPVSVNPYAEPDIYYVPMAERMRGVEVVKGSGNILFGPQTIGGVINFLTLVPPDHRHEMAELDAGFWAGEHRKSLLPSRRRPSRPPKCWSLPPISFPAAP